MEGVSKVMVVLAIILLVVFAGEVLVEGARPLKGKEVVAQPQNVVAQPQNFFGGIGGATTFPAPGFAAGFGFGPSGFCAFPGVGCVRVPTVPGGSGSIGGGLP